MVSPKKVIYSLPNDVNSTVSTLDSVPRFCPTIGATYTFGIIHFLRRCWQHKTAHINKSQDVVFGRPGMACPARLLPVRLSVRLSAMSNLINFSILIPAPPFRSLPQSALKRQNRLPCCYGIAETRRTTSAIFRLASHCGIEQKS